MAYADRVYKGVIQDLVNYGQWDQNPRPQYKDGTPARSLFITDWYQKYPANCTPIITLRRVAWKTAIRELITIYQQPTNVIKEMEDLGVNWWGDWDTGDGTIGQRYGATVKRYDLVNKLLDGLVNDPFSRRHIINLYQYADFEETPGLYPCAFMTMFSVRPTESGLALDMSLTQRSSDFGTAFSINALQYKALQMMVAKHCGYEVGRFSHHIQNVHVYERHLEALADLSERTPQYTEPKLILNVPDGTSFYDIKLEDFTLENYSPVQPQLKFELAI